MGCASGQKESTQIQKLPTVNGLLKVTISNAKIQHMTSTVFAMDPYIKIRVSNQSAITKVIKKGGKQPAFNETFQFFINSCYQTNGRYLQLQLWDENKTSDTLIGFGIADLDPLLRSKVPSQQVRIFLNHELKPAGIVNAIIEFKQQTIQHLSFRFQTASIRRKTSTLTNMNCWVQVTIGEQVLKTKKQKQTNQMPPVWIDQILTFNAIKIIKNCLITVYDDGEIVGQVTMQIQDLLKQHKQQSFAQEIHFKDVIAGTLRFQTLTGVNPQFSAIKRDYKRKPEQNKSEGSTKKVQQGKQEKQGKQGKNEKDGKQKQKQKDVKQIKQAKQGKKDKKESNQQIRDD